MKKLKLADVVTLTGSPSTQATRRSVKHVNFSAVSGSTTTTASGRQNSASLMDQYVHGLNEEILHDLTEMELWPSSLRRKYNEAMKEK